MSDSLLEIVDGLHAYADWQSAVRRSNDLTFRALNGHIVEDRRAHVRHRPIQLDRPMLARLKAGPLLTLLDVSAGGALIQTPSRLNPGALVLIEFLTPGTRQTTVMRSRVTRAHVAGLHGCVRYQGGCSFDQVLELSEFLHRPADRSSDIQEITSGDPLQAVRHLLAGARGLDKLGIARLLGDMQRMTDARASRRALIAYVEGWLRRQVPLLALRVRDASDATLAGSDVLSFRPAVSEPDGRPRVNIEFRPACGLDESQVRLLEAGACVMSILHTSA